MMYSLGIIFVSLDGQRVVDLDHVANGGRCVKFEFHDKRYCVYPIYYCHFFAAKSEIAEISDRPKKLRYDINDNNNIIFLFEVGPGVRSIPVYYYNVIYLRFHDHYDLYTAFVIVYAVHIAFLRMTRYVHWFTSENSATPNYQHKWTFMTDSFP